MSEKASTMWLNFFHAAGIPKGIDSKYAVVFDENRMRMDMLMDLNMDILRDMGIVAMGDRIAILKHAKKFSDEIKEQAVEPNKPTQSQISASSSKTCTSSQTRTSHEGHHHHPVRKYASPGMKEINTPATTAEPATTPRGKNPSTHQGLPRLAERVTQTKEKLQTAKASQESAPKKMIVLNKRTSTEGPLKEEVPVQKKIRVLPEQEGRYTIKMPEGTTPRTKKIIQSRLGPGPSLSALHSQSASEKKTVFARLGDSNVSSSTEEARTAPVSASKSESQLKLSSSQDQKPKQSVFERLGGRGKSAESTSSISSSTVHPKPLLQIKVDPTGLSPSSVRSRLDMKTHQEKTLKTIPSRISIPYITNRAKLKSEINSTITSAAASTTTRIISAKSNPPPSGTQSDGPIKAHRENDQKGSGEHEHLDREECRYVTRKVVASQIIVPQTVPKRQEESRGESNNSQQINKLCSRKNSVSPEKRRAPVSKKSLGSNSSDMATNQGDSKEVDSNEKLTRNCSEDEITCPTVPILWRPKGDIVYRTTLTGSRPLEQNTERNKSTHSRDAKNSVRNNRTMEKRISSGPDRRRKEEAVNRTRTSNREQRVTLRTTSDLDDYEHDDSRRAGTSSRASNSSLEKRIQDFIRSPAPPPVDGQVLQTIRMPSKTKGKVIVKKLIYKKIPRGTSGMVHLPEIDDPLADYFDESDS